MTGILKKTSNYVDFKRFKKVYIQYQMNIYDLADLIFRTYQVDAEEVQSPVYKSKIKNN